MSRLSIFIAATGAATLAALALSPARAADQLQPLSVTGGGGPLVRGAAPLPEFHLDFQLNEPGRPTQPLAGTDNLEIALTSPDNHIFRFLFSPRPQLGISLDHATGTHRGYAGLTWNLFDTPTVFGNFGLAGTYDVTTTSPNDPLSRPVGAPLMLHGAFELGYHFGDQHSLSLSIDEGRVPEFRLNGETSDELRLRYGLRF